MPETRPPAPIPDDERTVIYRPRRIAEGLAPGTVLGNTYRIEALLARGGMGEVYRARHIELGTAHAVKVILPSLANDPKMVRLLVEEARKLSRLRHDAIVAYEGLFRDERGLRYLVMEFVEGESLAAVITRRRLEPAEVLQLRDRLAQGLAAAHERGIIHRDVSPENIILPQGEVSRAKLIDFGIAKAADAEATVIGANFAGKQAYASPEQLGLFGGHVDLRSDIYSLGLVLANAAIGFGKKLDMGTGLTEVLAKRAQPPDLSALPAELRPVIAPMLAPKPDDRPPSMRALVSPPQAPAPAAAPTAVPAGARPRRAFGLVAAGVVVAAAAAVLFVFRTAIWPPSVETLRTELATATAGYECAKISSVIGADRAVEVTGHAASTVDIERLQRAITGIAGIGKVSFDVHELVWPYCQVVRLLQPYSAEPAPQVPMLALASPPAYSGERLALAIGMPNFDGYLYVDYFVRQGQVLHLLPNGRDRLNIKPAHNRFVLGRPPTLTCWTLGDVTGEQLVTAIASSRPLFTQPLPEIEGAQAYLDTLSKALGRARQTAAATLFFDLQQPRYPNPAATCPHA
jgi:hypothetical protein